MDQKDTPEVQDNLINIIPANPLKAMVEGDMLAIIFFSIFVVPVIFGSPVKFTLTTNV